MDVSSRGEHGGDRGDAPGPFDRVLCAVDGGPSSLVAVTQAAALVAPIGELTLISATSGGIRGTLTAAQARDALHAGWDLATSLGVPPALRLVGSGDAAGRVIKEAEVHDLTVVGGPRGTRGGGIARRSVSTELVHRARRPVLVARPPPHGIDFPYEIVVATDGSAHGWSAVRLAIALAKRYDARVTLVVAQENGAIDPHVAADAALASFAAAGIAPAVSTPAGRPVEQLVLAAHVARASLLVVGARDRALLSRGSVSEQVAHRAWCSVLVARQPGPAGEMSQTRAVL